ncbi:hypothetical protein ACF3OH_11395 [Chryseomicrobium aureum]|uniref:hypothetical protein n=1 Tax=Chryseomicrobium aureum TaxID=1441723 RepID=UPI00370D04ED
MIAIKIAYILDPTTEMTLYEQKRATQIQSKWPDSVKTSTNGLYQVLPVLFSQRNMDGCDVSSIFQELQALAELREFTS